jgi:glycosyltransferase involved in cell wall biosynthesis
MSVLVVLNNAIKKKSNRFTVTDGGLTFLNDLQSLNIKLCVTGRVALLEESEPTSFLNKNIGVHELGGVMSVSIVSIFFNYLRVFTQLIRIVKEGNFVYLYAPSNLCLFFYLINIFYPTNYAIYLRGDYVSSRFLGRYRNIVIIQKLYKRLLRKATFIIVAGNSLEVKSRIINDEVHQVVPMMSFGLQDVVKNRFDKDFNNILFVGRIDKEKGIEELLFAMKNIVEINKNTFLKIVGGGSKSYINKLIGFIQDMGLTDHIEFVGYISDQKTMRHHYLWADLFVLPSYHEGFPRVVYEAMIFRLPIIMTKIDAIDGFLVDRHSALLVEPRNIESIICAYKVYLHNVELKQFCINNASVLIESKLRDYKFKSHALQFDYLYKSLYLNKKINKI